MAITPKPGAKLEWFTDELQGRLLAAAGTGLKPRWVAFRCGMAPKALMGILEMGSKRDAVEPFRSFARRWVATEAELMEQKCKLWSAGERSAFEFLRERWPKVWGPDADPDYEVLPVDASNQDDLDQLEAILASPDDFGVLHLFEKHGRLRPDGT